MGPFSLLDAFNDDPPNRLSLGAVDGLARPISLTPTASCGIIRYMSSPPLVSSLRRIADGLWTLDVMRRFPGGVLLPARGTVIRLADGALWVHSPTPLSAELAAAIDAEGPVRHLVGPNRLHHLSLGHWAARYPHAELWAARGLPEKRSDLKFTGTLGSPSTAGSRSPAAPWAADIEPLLLAGAPLLNEVVFFHRASRTLICTDLLFNVARPATWRTGLALTLMGTKARFATSRAWWLYTKDRAALKISLERVLRWNFARVIPAHGDVVEQSSGAPDVREVTRTALRPLLS